MRQTIRKFRVIGRPITVNGSFSLVVVDTVGRPHLPLTTFYHRLRQQLADGCFLQVKRVKQDPLDLVNRPAI